MTALSSTRFGARTFEPRDIALVKQQFGLAEDPEYVYRAASMPEFNADATEFDAETIVNTDDGTGLPGKKPLPAHWQAYFILDNVPPEVAAEFEDASPSESRQHVSGLLDVTRLNAKQAGPSTVIVQEDEWISLPPEGETPTGTQ